MSYTLINSLNNKKECTCSDCGKYTGTYIIRARLLSWKCAHTFTLEFYNFKQDEFDTVIEQAKNCCDTDLGWFPVCNLPGETQNCEQYQGTLYCMDKCPGPEEHFSDICPWDDGPMEDIDEGEPSGDDSVCFDCDGLDLPCSRLEYKLCCEGTSKMEQVKDCEECPDDYDPNGCDPDESYILYCDYPSEGLQGGPITCDCYDENNGAYITCEDAEKCTTSDGEEYPCHLNCFDPTGNKVDPIRNQKTNAWECPCYNRFGQKKSRISECFCQERIGNYTDYTFEITGEYLDTDCRVTYRLKPYGGDITAAEPEACEMSCTWDYEIVWQIINSENNLVSWIYTSTRKDINFPETKPTVEVDEDGMPTSETWPTFPLKTPPRKINFRGDIYGCCGSYAEQCS